MKVGQDLAWRGGLNLGHQEITRGGTRGTLMILVTRPSERHLGVLMNQIFAQKGAKRGFSGCEVTPLGLAQRLFPPVAANSAGLAAVINQILGGAGAGGGARGFGVCKGGLGCEKGDWGVKRGFAVMQREFGVMQRGFEAMQRGVGVCKGGLG